MVFIAYSYIGSNWWYAYSLPVRPLQNNLFEVECEIMISAQANQKKYFVFNEEYRAFCE